MIVAVQKITATPWLCDGMLLSKNISLHAENYVVENQIVFGFKEEPGTLQPMVAFRFNYRLCETESQDGKWYGVRVTHEDYEAANGAFLCTEEEGSTALVSCNADDMSAMVAPFNIDREWIVTVLGETGQVTTFPVPYDPSFSRLFAQLVANAKAQNAQN